MVLLSLTNEYITYTLFGLVIFRVHTKTIVKGE
jgi:hypothetical protein